MKVLIVEEKYNNKKLNTFLLDKFPCLTKGTLYKALRKKDIRVNNIKTCENVALNTGDEVKVFIVDSLLLNSYTEPLKIIFEDNNILLIEKPANIEVTGEDSLTTQVQKIYKEKGINFVEPCHRLDRNTYGIILFAKNQEALSELLLLFKNSKIEKHYLTVVYGIPNKKYEYLVSYLFKDNKKSLVYISDTPKKGYLEIKTSYNVLETNLSKNLSMLDVQIYTGRTHQIRAHLAHIGLPILGDGKYGINKINKKFHKSTQLLCSYSLTFHVSNKSSIISYLDGKTFSLESFPFSLKEVN